MKGSQNIPITTFFLYFASKLRTICTKLIPCLTAVKNFRHLAIMLPSMSLACQTESMGEEMEAGI